MGRGVAEVDLLCCRVLCARLQGACSDPHPLIPPHKGEGTHVVIPVTTFAGKKVAVFGLGGSGLASASALLAGGADVVAYDDDAQSVAKANAAGIPTADLRKLDWSKIAALVLAPGVPLTHPVPHWSVELAQKAAVEVIGDIELFCRERARHAPDAPFVAITGTNGKSTTTALVAHLAASSRHGRAAWRQYRHRDPVA